MSELGSNDKLREHITDLRQLAEEMALTAEGVPGMNLTLSRDRIARVCRAYLAATSSSAVAEAKPVAWRYRYSGSESWRYVDHEHECNPHDCYERQPLYSAASSAIAARLSGKDWPARLECQAMEYDREGMTAFAEDCRELAAILSGAVVGVRNVADAD